MRFIVLIIIFSLTFFCNSLAASETKAVVDYNKVGEILEKQEPLTAEEKQWFEKFLEGTFLAEGWHDITDNILAKIDKQERAKQRLAMKELGDKIGREWAKDNAMRKIDTAMLKRWGALLKKTVDDQPSRLSALIAELNREIDLILGVGSPGTSSLQE